MGDAKYNGTGTVLDSICRRKIVEIAGIPEETYERWKRNYSVTSFQKSKKFALALSQKQINVIAEIKKASPSAGIIRADVDAAAIAGIYRDNGAAAISVVTDRGFFHGDLTWLRQVKDAVSLPVLRKDFILDEKQVYESKVAGADAVLLIAAILDKSRLQALYSLIYSLGMEALVEIRTQLELESALGAGAEIIGINNRNLENFKVGTAEFVSLVKHIPGNKIVVAESGIQSRDDLLFMREHGADAVLVGTHLMRASNPGEALLQLTAA